MDQSIDPRPSAIGGPFSLTAYLRRHWKGLIIAAAVAALLSWSYERLALLGITQDTLDDYAEIARLTESQIESLKSDNAALRDMSSLKYLLFLPMLAITWLCMRFHRTKPFSTMNLFYATCGFAVGTLLSRMGTAASRYVMDRDFTDCLLALLLPVCPAIVVTWPALPRWIRSGAWRDYPWLVRLLACGTTGLASFLLLEGQLNGPVAPHLWMVPANILYWCLLFALIHCATCSMRVSATACLVLSTIVGAANNQLQQWRGDYIMTSDLMAIRTALNVAGNYSIVINPRLVAAIAICTLLVFLAWKLPGRRTKPKLPWQARLAVPVAVLPIAAVAICLAMSTSLFYNGIDELNWDTNAAVDDNGYMAYFLANLKSMTEPVTVDGYDPGIADQAMAGTEPLPSEGTRSPVIIAIQNESFADPRAVGHIETDKPIFPYISALSENTQKGFATTSVRNGPTAITEFEFMAEASMRFLPESSNPYLQYVTSPMPSITSTLAGQPAPYHTIMYHPYHASGYNRANVYKHFGFDEILFLESWEDKDQMREIVTDRQDYEDVIELYENFRTSDPDGPLFIFNVTIQNHGDYSNPMPDFTDPVTITNMDAMHELDMYVNLMHESDAAFQVLVDYFENCGEDVIILMYGDHQAYLSGNALEQLKSATWHGNETDTNVAEFTVPYVIWANYDIPEIDQFHGGGELGEYDRTSVTFLGTKLLELAGVRLTDYERYLIGIQAEFPVITAYDARNLSQEHVEPGQDAVLDQTLSEWAMMQYNRIFDHENRLDERYTP